MRSHKSVTPPAAPLEEWIASQVPALRIKSTATLTGSPRSDDLEACPERIVSARTAGDRRLVAAGWGIAGAEQVGPSYAVNFATTFELGTTGTCMISDGAVAVFRADALLMLTQTAVSGSRSFAAFAAMSPQCGSGMATSCQRPGPSCGSTATVCSSLRWRRRTKAAAQQAACP